MPSIDLRPLPSLAYMLSTILAGQTCIVTGDASHRGLEGGVKVSQPFSVLCTLFVWKGDEEEVQC